jgi:hypothetical protein
MTIKPKYYKFKKKHSADFTSTSRVQCYGLIRSGLTGLQWTNTIAYFGSKAMAKQEKGFVVLSPDEDVILFRPLSKHDPQTALLNFFSNVAS